MRHQATALQPMNPAHARTVSPFVSPGTARGEVTCKEDPGQTCIRKEVKPGVFLCKCFPTECGSAWSQAPGCQTITWKEPVIQPQQVPRPFQSRPPARGRQMARAEALKCPPHLKYCPTLGICIPPQAPCPGSVPDITAAPRPSSVPGHVRRATMAVGNPKPVRRVRAAPLLIPHF